MKIMALAASIAAALVIPSGVASVAVTQTPPDPAAKVCNDLRTYGHWSTLALGDSVVAGSGASVPERGWIQLLAWKIQPGQTWNLGLNGSTTAMHLPGGTEHWRVQQLQWAQPSLVLMDWRINDEWVQYNQGNSTPAIVASQYHTLINSIRSYSPNSSIMVVNPPYFADSWLDDQLASQHATARDYSAAIKAQALADNVLYLDTARFFPVYAEGDTDYNHLYSDAQHPGDAGYATMRTALESAIRFRCY